MRNPLMLPLVAFLVGVAPSDIGKPDVDLPESAWRGAEIASIREHLRGAEAMLLAADVSHLTTAQRERRFESIALLQGYRRAGVFPQNRHVLGRSSPVFVDDRGVHCAMAYLIAASGRPDLVARVVSTNNETYVRELADEPEFRAWLDGAGLSLAEAARIQPAYRPPNPTPVIHEISTPYVVATGLSTAASGAAIAAGLDVLRVRSGVRTGLFGVLAGSTSLALGIPRLDDDDWSGRLGIVNVAVGMVSLAVGVRGLLRGSPSVALESRSVSSGRTISPVFNSSLRSVGVSIQF